ncbi:hypothetical protein BN1002_01362 [Bacillus sp. B-jedd]|nr:hypothetical protein BN1002_01362 [Bacillus sp. B-jedd]
MEPPRRHRRLFVQLQRLAPRGRFGPECEVKERLPLLALQRLSGLTKALPLFEGVSTCRFIPQDIELASSNLPSHEKTCSVF